MEKNKQNKKKKVYEIITVQSLKDDVEFYYKELKDPDGDENDFYSSCAVDNLCENEQVTLDFVKQLTKKEFDIVVAYIYSAVKKFKNAEMAFIVLDHFKKIYKSIPIENKIEDILFGVNMLLFELTKIGDYHHKNTVTLQTLKEDVILCNKIIQKQLETPPNNKMRDCYDGLYWYSIYALNNLLQDKDITLEFIKQLDKGEFDVVKTVVKKLVEKLDDKDIAKSLLDKYNIFYPASSETDENYFFLLEYLKK